MRIHNGGTANTMLRRVWLTILLWDVVIFR